MPAARCSASRWRFQASASTCRLWTASATGSACCSRRRGDRRKEVSMIRGMHAMFYSSQAEALRVFLRDKLGLNGTDVGGGWLIFDAPEADLGVHPLEGGEP